MPDRDLYMPRDRYLAALRRQRARIASGLKLKAYDSDEIGNKYTDCTWGLCSDEKAAWPDAEDHLWPEQFLNEGRVARKYLGREQHCPFSGNEPSDNNGCFHKCNIFKASQKKPAPTRDQALALFDKKIAEVEAA